VVESKGAVPGGHRVAGLCPGWDRAATALRGPPAAGRKLAKRLRLLGFLLGHRSPTCETALLATIAAAVWSYIAHTDAIDAMRSADQPNFCSHLHEKARSAGLSGVPLPGFEADTPESGFADFACKSALSVFGRTALVGQVTACN
jgi:hypothetical protein